MNIAILSFYSGLVDRGVETWAKNVKEKLSDSSQIDIFDGESYGNKINWDNKNSFYWAFLVARHAIATLPKWKSYDVIVPTNGTLQVLVCRIVTILFGKPMIVFGHSGPGRDDKWNLICSPNIFVAFSDAQKKWAEKYKLPWTKVVKIPHGVDIAIFTPAKKKPRSGVVLCVAADIPSKRVGLVRAAAAAAGMKFVHIGKGGRDVSFDQMPKVYREADVFCFVPEPWEAFGLVYLEAMSANLPVVATNDPIRREIVGDAGILIKDPENIDALASALGSAYSKDWDSKPRHQAEKFSWKGALVKYQELFSTLSK